jgi:hypothetical protein
MALSPRWRKLTLTVHVLVSVGWMGTVAVFVAIELAARLGPEPELKRVLWLALDATGWTLLVPLAVATLATGLISSLGTVWGLWRHYWVIFKLLITLFATLVLIAQTRSFDLMAERAADPAIDPDALGSPFLHTAGGLAVLALALILAIYKPRGMTRHGQRQKHRQRVTAGSGL